MFLYELESLSSGEFLLFNSKIKLPFSIVNIKSGVIALFVKSLVIESPVLGFNLDIYSMASFNFSSVKFNFSDNLENFFLENESKSFSNIFIEFSIDSLGFFLFN